MVSDVEDLTLLSVEEYEKKKAEFEAGHAELLSEDNERRRRGEIVPTRLEVTALSSDKKSFIKIDYTSEQKRVIVAGKKKKQSKPLSRV